MEQEKDKRNNARWVLAKKARIKMAHEETYTDCLIRDISLKGLSVVMPERLCRDEYAKVSIMLSDDLTLEVEVWVVWHKAVEGSALCGLYFSKIRDMDKEKIYQFVQKNYPQEVVGKWWDIDPAERTEVMSEHVAIEDRRVFNRFPVAVPVDVLDVNTGEESKAYAMDISAKGVGLVLDEEKLSCPREVEMWLHIPDKGEPLYNRGSVAWTNVLENGKQRVGICLEKADLMGLSRVLRTK
jgi:hypothetical protein